MLSSSPAKIHEPRVTGVSPRPTDQRQRQKTAKHEGVRHVRDHACSVERRWRCGPLVGAVLRHEVGLSPPATWASSPPRA
jgi:hypothetical protein